MAVRVRLADTEEEALAAHAILRENVKMVGFVTRGAVLEKLRRREIAVARGPRKPDILGCVCFHMRRDRVITIYEIAASGAAAGRGVGAALVDWLSREGRRRGAVAIKLKCTADNVAGNKFYERVGFSLRGEEAGRKRRLLIWRLELGGGFFK